MLKTVLNRIHSSQKPLIFAIDGPCGAGKSTLAAEIAAAIDCNIIRADDFFLPPEAPRGDINCNIARLESALKELSAARGNEQVTYGRYDCRSGQTVDITVTPKPVTVVEGAYCACPDLRRYYGFFVFLDIPGQKQSERLKLRNPRMYDRFVTEWIPLEDAYFEKYGIREMAKQQPNLYFKYKI